MAPSGFPDRHDRRCEYLTFGRKAVTIPLNGAECLELDARKAGVTVQRHICTRRGFEIRNTSLAKSHPQRRIRPPAWRK